MVANSRVNGGEEMSNFNLGISQSKGYESANLELIKVTTNEQGQKLVSGRELHEVLKVQKDFTNWVKNQLESVDAVENDDYTKVAFKGELSKTGQTSHDYILTLDIAKEICMCVGVAPRTNEETRRLSKQVRKYFIECEKVAQQSHEMPKMTFEEIMIAQLQEQQRIKQQQAMIEKQVQTVEQRMTHFEENSALEPGEYNLVCSRVSSRVHAVLKERGIKREQIGELFKALNRDIKEITGVKTRTQLRKRHLDMVPDFINDWQPSRATMITINQMSLDF